GGEEFFAFAGIGGPAGHAHFFAQIDEFVADGALGDGGLEAGAVQGRARGEAVGVEDERGGVEFRGALELRRRRLEEIEGDLTRAIDDVVSRAPKAVGFRGPDVDAEGGGESGGGGAFHDAGHEGAARDVGGTVHERAKVYLRNPGNAFEFRAF